MTTMAERVIGCPYRSGLRCVKGPSCETCGWNPEVEREREGNLYSGKVKTYLHLNLSSIKAEDKRQSRLFQEGAQ